MRMHRLYVAVTVAACADYGIGGIAWPLSRGRDAANYVIYFLDMWNSHPVYPTLMLFRTPIAPLFFGPLLELGGSALVEAALGVAYVVAVLALTAAAARLNRRCAVIFSVLLLVYTPYVALFHTVSSDSVFAFLLSLWILAAVRALESPTARRFAWLGVGTVVLVLTRPDAQLFIAFALAPLLLRRPWRRRLEMAGAYAAVAVVLLVGWAAANDARYGEFTVARGGPGNVPTYRVFVLAHMVSPADGPRSRQLVDLVDRRLLTVWPYDRYHVTQSEFFNEMNDNMWNDLVVLDDQVWGWSDNYSHLRGVALEAIRRHPATYLRSFAADARQGFWAAFEIPTPKVEPVSAAAQPAPSPPPGPGLLPTRDRLWWALSSPDRRAYFNRYGLFWTNASVQRRATRLRSRSMQLLSDVPNRTGSPWLARAFDRWARDFPRALEWILLALIGLALRRPRRTYPYVVVGILGAIVVLATFAGLPPITAYRVPFDPVFILLAVASFTAAGSINLPRLPRLRRRRA